jgi:hypothetical protein
MPGFWELPEREQLPNAQPAEVLGAFKHGITVHSYRIQVWRTPVPRGVGDCHWIALADLNSLPLSTIFKKALKVVENQRKPLRALRASVGN